MRSEPGAPGRPLAPPVAGPRRLHPVSLVRGLDPRSLLQVLPALAVVGIQLDGATAVAAVVLGLGALAVVRVLLWQRHTYEVTATSVVERRGLVNRRERTVELDRLQQVEIDRSLVDRLAGTAVLRLETASDAGEAELELRVVAEAEAERLRAVLLPHATGTGTGDAPAVTELLHVPLAHVVLASVTGRRLLAVPVVIGAAVGLLDDLDLFRDAEDVATDAFVALGVAAVAALVVGLLVASVVAALVVGVLRDGDFRIRQVGTDLHVTRGLLSTREAVLPRTRLQKVAIHHGWLRRRLGFASVTLYSAGGVAGEATQERRLVVPLVPAAAALPLVRSLVPDAGTPPDPAGHPLAARRRGRVRHLVRAVATWPVAALAVRGLGGTATTVVTVTAVMAVVSLAVAWWLADREYAHLASAVGERWVRARQGALSVTESLSLRGKAQATAVHTDPFQRRLGLATLVVQVAGPGGSVRMEDLGAADARARQRQLDERWVGARRVSGSSATP